MSVFLVGGGWDDTQVPALYGGFHAAATDRARRRRPRILLVVSGTRKQDGGYHKKFVHTLALAGRHRLRMVRVPAGSLLDPAELEGIDGLFVGGGTTPDYHASLSPSYAAIRELVASGVPYAGFSAGAAIAARRAIIGGWLLDGVPVCPEDSNEGLEEVTVVDGIGLVDGAVDVHASQWGNLSRLVAVVGAGLAPEGVGLDECASLAVETGEVTGSGSAWRVSHAAGAVVVRR